MAGKTHQASTLIRSRIVGHGDVNPAELLANPEIRAHYLEGGLATNHQGDTK